jgi:3-deoxy-D-manno-octulosonate 8-phosphate phosphatase (KDO 8-P phosphatase)
MPRRRSATPTARRRPVPAPPLREPAAPPRPRRRVTPEPLPSVEALLRGPISGPVRIIFLDVDGTLTDGVIGFDQHGDSRNFFIRDGLSLEWARRNHVLPVVLSGRDSEAVRLRMMDLGLEYYGGLADKVAVAERVLAREKATWRQCVMVGDDLPDVPMLKRVGWPIAVADAVREVKVIAKTVTGASGGKGAVREVVEMVLRHNGTWEKVLERYEAL